MDSPVFPGDLFKMINILFVAHADAALRPLGLTCAQSDLLEYLAERGAEETTVQDIGQHFHLKHPTVIGFLHRLEQKGFVTSSVSQRDRRCRVIRLTEKFDEVQRVMRETRDTIDARVTRGFTAEELIQLEEYLSRVYHNISEV
ncbi:MarR family winged helix-turn-helix transcriptional regulator [Candidatus Agathobaculum pullicola]|uniref:MarR family winged helix-turn-helix transcriptional regulator n=1 Tax=Candidatus Agathobaculum pullicola TaxID=2838426 RepID=UPI003F8FF7E1